METSKDKKLLYPKAGVDVWVNTQKIDINTPSEILSYIIKLSKKAKKNTVRIENWTLKYIMEHANLNNQTEVFNFIDELENSNNYKNKLRNAYAKYLKFYNIEPAIPANLPKTYTKDSKQIRIPTTERLEMLIAYAGKLLGTKLQLSLETGLRPVELMKLKTKDIDLEQRLVYPITAKRGAPRTLKISQALITRINEHILRNKLTPENKLFNGNETSYGKDYRALRNKLAHKLKIPELQQIRLYDFRHYFATMLYQKTKDILFVKQQMGHKSINTTLIYTQLLSFDKTEDYLCKTATTLNEATELIEHGYEYVTEMNGTKLFKKRK